MLKRYNIMLKITKICLIGVLVLFAFIIGVYSISRQDIRISGNNIAIIPHLIGKSEASADAPIFTGNGKNSYKISAEKITKNTDGLYHMNNISGVYNLQHNQNITIAANLGSINNYDDIIILNNNVKIGYEDYVLLSDKLDLDLRTKSIESQDHVEVISSSGSISADKFKTTKELSQITFYGNVKADFNISNND